MDKRTMVLAGVLAVMAAVYVFFFTGWFSNEPIALQSRPEEPRWRRDREPPQTMWVRFAMDARLPVTKVLVEPVIEPGAETGTVDGVFVGTETGPVWQMELDPEGGVPETVQTFLYGERLSGLKSVLERRGAAPLVPGQKYRLTVEAGGRTGVHEFVAEPYDPRPRGAAAR